MGAPHGFLDVQRAHNPERPPLERVRDWNEFHQKVPETTLREQGSRCMDCGLPFCHTGASIAGMASGCPLHNLIPEWNDLVYRGRWSEAYERLDATNNFPEFTGRVCPAPCEGSCVLGLSGQPVTIKQLEKSIIDHAFDEHLVTPRPPSVRTGKRVAVVGSGPAGLACADELNKQGHTVTVFERSDRPGGLLMYGIPNMKLDKSLVERRARLMEQEGIRFRTGTEVGRDVSVDDLRAGHDAIVLAVGAGRPRDLAVEGRNASGIHFALEFLTLNTQSLLDRPLGGGSPLSAEGKDVIVIGGGDTGTDCVGTSLRQGCRSLVQFEIMPRSPATRASDNPWPQWPKVHRTDYGQEEAAARFGEDPRRFQVVTKRFEADAKGRICAVHTVEIEWAKGPDGRPTMSEKPGTERRWPADLVLLAMGFLGPERSALTERLGIAFDPRGNIALDARRATNVPGVFAAGDAARGQSLVVWAIAEGRQTAAAVHEFLGAGSASDVAESNRAA